MFPSCNGLLYVYQQSKILFVRSQIILWRLLHRSNGNKNFVSGSNFTVLCFPYITSYHMWAAAFFFTSCLYPFSIAIIKKAKYKSSLLYGFLWNFLQYHIAIRILVSPILVYKLCPSSDE
ncbi:hypothetical protein L1049_026954 [Liquidambar formosana]|uniref:Uncharacterized protein n=1 Tax=Liquidambar formosana TaxID=63359 RepID=A0AAP0R7R5_LIQFO